MGLMAKQIPVLQSILLQCLFLASACFLCGESSLVTTPTIVPESSLSNNPDDADVLAEESASARSFAAFGESFAMPDGDALFYSGMSDMTHVQVEAAGLTQDTKPQVTKLESTESTKPPKGKQKMMGRVLLGRKKTPIEHKFNCDNLKADIIEKHMAGPLLKFKDRTSRTTFTVPSKAKYCIKGLGCVGAVWQRFHNGRFRGKQKIHIKGDGLKARIPQTLYPRGKERAGIYPLNSPRMAITSDGGCSAKMAFRRFTSAPDLPSSIKKGELMKMSSFILEASVCNTKSKPIKCTTKKAMLACHVRRVVRFTRGMEMTQQRRGNRKRRWSRRRWSRRRWRRRLFIRSGHYNCPHALKVMNMQ